MHWSRRAALISGATTLLAAPALAAMYVAANGGFGASDLGAFTFWSAFLAALVSTIAPALVRSGAKRRRRVATMVAALVGLLVGVAYTFVVALVLGPMVHAFSFPILYLWAVAAALGLALAALLRPAHVATEDERPRRWLRRALVGAAVVLVAAAASPFVMLLGSLYIWGRAEREVHLIPAGYEGPVVIVFGDSTGAPERREGRARLYEIPANGVLRTRFAANPGWGRPDYFHVDAAGERTPIVPGTPCADSLPGDPVQACQMPQMYVMGREAPAYTTYLVGRRETRDAMRARWDSTVQWAVFGDSAYRSPTQTRSRS
jgi:MFS family permease